MQAGSDRADHLRLGKGRIEATAGDPVDLAGNTTRPSVRRRSLSFRKNVMLLRDGRVHRVVVETRCDHRDVHAPFVGRIEVHELYRRGTGVLTHFPVRQGLSDSDRPRLKRTAAQPLGGLARITLHAAKGDLVPLERVIKAAPDGRRQGFGPPFAALTQQRPRALSRGRGRTCFLRTLNRRLSTSSPSRPAGWADSPWRGPPGRTAPSAAPPPSSWHRGRASGSCAGRIPRASRRTPCGSPR